MDGLLAKTFTFDATNMLSKVVDSKAGELENEYNGLGFRVASTRPEEKIEYLCDLSRDYYNLLERTVNGETESFIYDNNVVSMSKSGNNYYYLQDELGSPMYMTGTDGVALSSYAFDDFGRNIDPRTGKLRKHEYTTDGDIIQPFAFTGYQEDEVSGLKFAQARFYSAENGRFVGEDQVRGFVSTPESQNHYLYCYNNVTALIDTNGKTATSIDFIPNTYIEAPDTEKNMIPDSNSYFIPNTYITSSTVSNCDESVEADVGSGENTVLDALNKALNLVDYAGIYYRGKYMHYSKQLVNNAKKITAAARPGCKLSATQSNNAIRNGLKSERSALKNSARYASTLAESMKKTGDKLAFLAIGLDVAAGVSDNIKNKTYDRIIDDATVDFAITGGTILLADAASTLAGAAVATLTGAAATAAAPVLIGAVAAAVGVGMLLTAFTDKAKLSNEKTVRDTVKDVYHDGVSELGGWLDNKLGLSQ